jgi:hypothetical protein
MNPIAVRLMAIRKTLYKCAFCRDTGQVNRMWMHGGNWTVIKVPCPYCTKPADAKPA